MAENKTMFIGVAQIQQDWGISRSKAYQIIKDLNAELKKKNPGALVVSCKQFNYSAFSRINQSETQEALWEVRNHS